MLWYIAGQAMRHRYLIYSILRTVHIAHACATVPIQIEQKMSYCHLLNVHSFALV